MVTTGQSPARKRILIVDDDPSIRYMLSRVLLDEQYAVLSAADGREGLQLAAANEVDLVLLDLKMPAMDGSGNVAPVGALAPRPAGHYYDGLSAPAIAGGPGRHQRVVAETAGFSHAAGNDKETAGPGRRLKMISD